MFFTLEYVIKNDKLDFDAIYHKYVHLVLYIAKQILFDDDLAKDAAQETFIRVFGSLTKFDTDDCNKLKSWICIIARNVSTDIYRKLKREKENIDYWDSEQLAETFSSTDYGPLEKLTIKELTDEVRSIIYALDRSYKDVIILKCYIGFDNDEVAKTLNISVNNVTVRLHRARKMILDKLKYNSSQEGCSYEFI